jgi:two-component system OmpR family response regulator
MTQVLVADDDVNIRSLVRVCLEQTGLTVREASDGEEALRLFADQPADLVVLDLMMPGVDGWEICRRLRADSEVPVLMLTARGETGDKVRGLSLGADDYLVKPFDPPELIARVQALLRRCRIAASAFLDVGGARIDLAAREVRCGEERVTLPRREFELLAELATHMGRTLTRDQLIERVWGYDFSGDDRTVDVHVKRLRERFPESSCGFAIRTMRGLGYRLEEI